MQERKVHAMRRFYRAHKHLAAIAVGVASVVGVSAFGVSAAATAGGANGVNAGVGTSVGGANGINAGLGATIGGPNGVNTGLNAAVATRAVSIPA